MHSEEELIFTKYPYIRHQRSKLLQCPDVHLLSHFQYFKNQFQCCKELLLYYTVFQSNSLPAVS